MKLVIALAAAILTGCTTCPPHKEQLMLKVPAELLQSPTSIEKL